MENIVEVLGRRVPKLLVIRMPVALGGTIIIVPADLIDTVQIRVDAKDWSLERGLDADTVVSTRVPWLSILQQGAVVIRVFFQQCHRGAESVHEQAASASAACVRQ